MVMEKFEDLTVKDLTDRLESDLSGPNRSEAFRKLRDELVLLETEIRTELARGMPKADFAKLNSIYLAANASIKTLDALRSS